MQVLVSSARVEKECSWRQALGGEVKAAEGGGEYGRMAIRTTQASRLYSAEAEHSQQVWMSHGDEAIRLPDGFISVATSEQVPVPGRASGLFCMNTASKQRAYSRNGRAMAAKISGLRGLGPLCVLRSACRLQILKQIRAPVCAPLTLPQFAGSGHLIRHQQTGAGATQLVFWCWIQSWVPERAAACLSLSAQRLACGDQHRAWRVEIATSRLTVPLTYTFTMW